MTFYTGKVAAIVAVANPRRSRSVVSFRGDEECGLYVYGLRNEFGTSLAARGTRAELEAFVEAHQPS